ncbi:alcohol acetyltransferase [Apodospora peruviana]|uniref:Alcohol acetyltransferase n=1 Tax=Apodospora peruviana TaxID=516989 RepID=A0AAE0LYV5_9PEZI|nr:alcohol acetyltransferase [Apodospora peruviana]
MPDIPVLNDKTKLLRHASPNEQRTITREHLNFYHNVIIGAVYEFGDRFHVESRHSYIAPVRRCVEEHPFLNVVVGDRHTEKAFYQLATTFNLEDHITVSDRVSDDNYWTEVEGVLRTSVDKPLSPSSPLWRVIVIPLPKRNSALIAFVYSHSILDGPSGVAFHRSFLTAVRSAQNDNSPYITTPETFTLGEQFDTPKRFTISWLFLLGPLLGLFLPTFLVNWLGITGNVTAPDKGTWTGSDIFFDEAKGPRTKLVLREIDAKLVENALRASREHGVRLTGVLHQLMVRALSKAFAQHTTSGPITNFISQTAIDMRRAAGIPATEMGEFASGVYVTHPVIDETTWKGPLTEEEWAAARASTAKFADAASRLRDQPVGLLRYLPSMRKWMTGKLGKRRDCSYELSNVGAFVDHDEGEADGEGKTKITKMVFAQPGMVIGCPICLNVASVKGGSLVYTISWPAGALGVPEGVDEDELIRGVCDSLKAVFERF